MARGCGEKHICKSKWYKTLTWAEHILEVAMFKNCTPLWREAHLQVKMLQNTSGCRSHFASSRSSKMARRCGAKHILQVKMWKTLTGLGPLLVGVRCPKMARRCGEKHICKAKCAKHLRFAAFREVSN